MLLPDWDVFWDFVTSQLPWVQLQFLENDDSSDICEPTHRKDPNDRKNQGSEKSPIFAILTTYEN